jgi:signal transduction histidine kinase
LERLLAIDPRDLDSALVAAAQALTDALGADKVDAFLYDETTATLVARGTSPTPLGRKQRALGLDRLPIANGGRAVEVFQTGKPRRAGRVDRDVRELRGIRLELRIRSDISVPLDVAGERRGLLAAASKAPDFFSARDLDFLKTIGRWVGIVAHRAELAERAASEAAARGRQAAAEELITILAHDLRNFLTPLRARLQLLERRARHDGHDAYRHHAEELMRTVDRLDRLVADLLDAARLERGLFALSPRRVDLVELVKETVVELAADTAAIEVRPRVDKLVVAADPDRLRQVLENLLSNALKVQPPDAPVLVELGVCGAWAVVSVEDRGPGVPPDVLPRLFERFGAGSDSVGLGLGLFLANGITRAHGGSLEVASRPGQGARFLVRLPLG